MSLTKYIFGTGDNTLKHKKPVYVLTARRRTIFPGASVWMVCSWLNLAVHCPIHNFGRVDNILPHKREDYEMPKHDKTTAPTAFSVIAAYFCNPLSVIMNNTSLSFTATRYHITSTHLLHRTRHHSHTLTLTCCV